MNEYKMQESNNPCYEKTMFKKFNPKTCKDN